METITELLKVNLATGECNINYIILVLISPF